jgi:hypothetical protein
VFLFSFQITDSHMAPLSRSIQGSHDLHEPVRQKMQMMLMYDAYYTYRLAFSKPQVVDGNIIDAETAVKINVSDSHLLCNF